MTNDSSPKAAAVLLVKGNPGDVRLIQEALRDSTLRTRLHVAKDGFEALAFLRQEDGHREAPRPDLILLALRLLREGGLEILAEIKADPQLWSIPVVVLSASEWDVDIERSYALHANSYVCKPKELDEFITTIQAIENFWLGIARRSSTRTAAAA